MTRSLITAAIVAIVAGLALPLTSDAQQARQTQTKKAKAKPKPESTSKPAAGNDSTVSLHSRLFDPVHRKGS